MKRIIVRSGLGLLLVVLTPSIGFAQMLADPVARSGEGNVSIDGGFAKSKVDYDLRRDATIERTWIFADLGLGVSPAADAFALVGIDIKGKYDDTSLEGKGFMLGGGGRFHIYSKNNLDFSAHAQMSYINETFKGDYYYSPFGREIGDVTIDFDVFEMLIGGLVSYQVQPKFSLYGGIELVPFSDGDAKAKSNTSIYEGKSSSDVERDNILNLRIGARFQASDVTIHPFVIFAGETTLGLAASTKI